MFTPRIRADGSQTGDFDSADVIVQSGSYSYIAPDGTLISVSYVADENGFQAFGDHLPTPPPIPESILNSLNTLQSGQQQVDGQATHLSKASQGEAHRVIEKERSAII